VLHEIETLKMLVNIDARHVLTYIDLGLSNGCPLFPRKQRKSGHARSSDSGQEQSYALQQKSYSITSSASSTIDCRTVRPSALAAFMLSCCARAATGQAAAAPPMLSTIFDYTRPVDAGCAWQGPSQTAD
jgi:hypothetical protein